MTFPPPHILSSKTQTATPLGGARIVGERRLSPRGADARRGTCASIATEIEIEPGASIALRVGIRAHEGPIEAYPSDPNRGREVPPAVALYYPPPRAASAGGSTGGGVPLELRCRSGAAPRAATDRSVGTTLLDATSQCAQLDSVFGAPAHAAVRIYSDALLLPGRHPDFSMTFNVVTIVQTVMAFIFGTIFNLLTRAPRTKAKKPAALKKTPGRFGEWCGARRNDGEGGLAGRA